MLMERFVKLNELEGLNNYQKKPLVKMRKTPCFGKCPYFEVSFFNDGSNFLYLIPFNEGKREQ